MCARTQTNRLSILYRSLHSLVTSDPEIRLISLDVFDTVLLRETEPELARFGGIARAQHHALQRAGWPSPGGEGLYRARLWAHKRAYDEAAERGGEARHQEILRGVCRFCQLDPGTIPLLTQAEVAWEAAHLVANRRLLAWLNTLTPPRPVILVSDMYLATEDVRHLLTEITPALASLSLYVSAAFQQTKRRGELFATVAAAERVAPGSILHLGDHPLADGVQPIRAGWRAMVVQRNPLWRGLHSLRHRWVRRRLARSGWLT